MIRVPATFRLPRTVWVLATVSLLNDAASEMIAPLLPLFLTATLGAGPAVVGLVEGVAEATSSVLKLFAGRLADRGTSQRALVVGGYALANAARPLMGLAGNWSHVLGLRFVDRIGKGLRTAPRDALLARSVAPDLRGRAFGVHRSADHLGAMLGPLLAAGLLALAVPMRQVFLLAGVVGTLVVAVAWAGLRDAPALPRAAPPPWLRWRDLAGRVRGLLVAVALFSAATVPEALVVLWAAERGLGLVWVPIVWAAMHLVKSLATAPAGVLTDHWGAVRVLALAWPARIVALAALAFVPAEVGPVIAGFIAYGAVLAVAEPAERALIAAHVRPEQRGTAYGWYYLLAGVGALPGAAAIGWVWQVAGSRPAMLAAAAASALACITAAAFARAAPRVA